MALGMSPGPLSMEISEMKLEIKPPHGCGIQPVNEIGGCDQNALEILKLREQLIDLSDLPTALSTPPIPRKPCDVG